MSDGFWVNAYAGVQSIPHFLDDALPLGRACIVRLSDGVWLLEDSACVTAPAAASNSELHLLVNGGK